MNFKGKLKENKENVLQPENAGLAFILNVCDKNPDSFKTENDLSKLISTRWNSVKTDLKLWATDLSKFKLGNTRTTLVQSTAWVVTFVGLESGKENTNAVKTAFNEIVNQAKYEGASVHISAKLFEVVPSAKEMLNLFLDKGVNVVLYKN